MGTNNSAKGGVIAAVKGVHRAGEQAEEHRRPRAFSLIQGENSRYEYQIPAEQHLTKELVLGNEGVISLTTRPPSRNEDRRGNTGSAWLTRASVLLT